MSSFLFKILGVSVGANMSLKRNWVPIIERVQRHLSSWNASTLSFGGRLTFSYPCLESFHFIFSLF